ncbi:MAG: hypothetical protein B7X28_00610 [Halothiobacillus sp. 13-55-253]|nr:MAG: hypothetical protein B7X28_00610 [Halothiobacillus sp. 13-55-253]
MSLKNAGVTLIDCDHRTPPEAGTGYPYIAIPQIKNGHIQLDGVRRISPENFADWTKKLKPQANDVIVVRRCSSGDSAVVPRGLECAIGQNLVVLRSDGKRVTPEFLRWLVRGPDWWEQVDKFINVGAVFDSLKCREIPHFELTIPPLNAQREIAALLGALDDRIALLRETNATLEAIAQAIFKSWFVDFDPVLAKAEGRVPEGMDEATAALFPDGFEESELGLIPRGWKVVSLGDVFDVTMGQSPPGHTYNEDEQGIPFYQGRTDFGFRFPKRRVYCSAPTRYAQLGDTLLSVRAPVGDVNIAIEKCAVGRGLAALRHPKGLSAFVYYQLNAMRSKLGAYNSEGTVFGAINKNQLLSMKIVSTRDNFTIEKSFELIAAILNMKIENNEKLIRGLTELLDILLPHLISGKLRLPECQNGIEKTTA